VYKILWALPPIKFGKAKTSKIWRNLRQLSTLTANISGRDYDINKR